MVEKVVPGVMPRELRYSASMSNDSSEAIAGRYEPEEVADISYANLVTSKVALPGVSTVDLHAPVLDIDVPHTVVPSSQPGHSHIYFDVAIPWDKYVKLLDVMAECGLVEPGFATSSKNRGYTAARVPWQKKPGYEPKKQQGRSFEANSLGGGC